MTKCNDLDQGSPNVFVRGPHKVMQNISRAGRRTQCVCFRIYYILPNQQNLGNFFSSFDKMALRGGWKGFAGRIYPAGRSLETPDLYKERVESSGFATTERWRSRRTAIAITIRVSISLLRLPSHVHTTPTCLIVSTYSSALPFTWIVLCLGFWWYIISWPF